MKFKPVFKFDSSQRKVRLFRFLWQRPGGWRADSSDWYSAKLSVAIVPKMFRFEREMFGWRLTFLGIQLHHLKAFGGVIV